MAFVVMKLIFAVLDLSFNSSTVIIKRTNEIYKKKCGCNYEHRLTELEFRVAENGSKMYASICGNTNQSTITLKSEIPKKKQKKQIISKNVS